MSCKHVQSLLPDWKANLEARDLFAAVEALPHDKRLSHAQKMRLQGHYGNKAAALLQLAQDGELEYIPGTLTMWVELRWAARHEAVVHLEDLLLRRTRIGLLLRQGGLALLPRIKEICQPELAWGRAALGAGASCLFSFVEQTLFFA